LALAVAQKVRAPTELRQRQGGVFERDAAHFSIQVDDVAKGLAGRKVSPDAGLGVEPQALACIALQVADAKLCALPAPCRKP
jgi:hypothetical protein